MAPARVLDRGRAALVVVDVQEAFRPAVLDFDRVAAGVATLVQGARILGLPVIVTQQYPKGLGATVPEVAEHLDGIEPIDKVAFSAAAADGFDLSGRDQVLICGIESHVCVSQTAHDLLDRGVQVQVARDAVSSRTEADRQALIEGLRSGAIDCVATDHAPHAREEKEQPFEIAPMGVTGLETAFSALHTGLVIPGVVELGLLVERMTAGGQPFGLPVPRIERGEPANVVLVDLDAEWEVGEAGYESRSANCAFAGRRLTGRVRMTIASGAVAYRERSFALEAVR